MRPSRRAAWVSPAMVMAFALAACGGPQEPGDAGEECFRDNDCKYGLVCVAPPDSDTRVCSSDVSGLVNYVPGPSPPPDEEGEGGAPGELPEGDAGANG